MNKVKISRTNSKLGHDIPSVNMPVGLTCRSDAPCFAKCYARKGNFRFDSVKQAHISNLKAYQEDPAYFFDCIATESHLARYFRWHSSGDIVDYAYFDGMVKVARKNKGTKFLAFTKKFDIVNKWLEEHKGLPKNLTIIFSGWGAEFKVLNPHNLPVAHCLLKGDKNPDYIPEGAIPCGGHCENCLACWQLKQGQAVYFKEH